VPDESLQAVAARLAAQTEALAALGAALRLRASGEQAPPSVRACLDEVVEALGVSQAIATAAPDDLSRALAPVRAVFSQAADLLSDPSRAPGWSYTDAELLQSLGQNSAAFAEVVRDVVAPELGGLGERLSRPGAAFLDVGVGVAALSIAMCRAYPELRVVGIDPFEPPLALARRNVAAAGLEERVELRRGRVEELEERDTFAAAFLPGPFLAATAVDEGCRHVYEALEPGGWVLFGMYRGAGPLEDALARLRAARSGGAVLHAADAEERLRAAGFDSVRTFTAELGIPSQLVAGRRPA
jgi:predicted RNA methylase